MLITIKKKSLVLDCQKLQQDFTHLQLTFRVYQFAHLQKQGGKIQVERKLNHSDQLLGFREIDDLVLLLCGERQVGHFLQLTLSRREIPKLDEKSSEAKQ